MLSLNHFNCHNMFRIQKLTSASNKLDTMSPQLYPFSVQLSTNNSPTGPFPCHYNFIINTTTLNLAYIMHNLPYFTRTKPANAHTFKMMNDLANCHMQLTSKLGNGMNIMQYSFIRFPPKKERLQKHSTDVLVENGQHEWLLMNDN